MNEIIREPKQKRAIEKKEKIIAAGFNLICEMGYYNTNTAMIAKEAGVSTGIVYQYFNDKHDIFMDGLEKYGDEIFFPFKKYIKSICISNISDDLRNMINKYIKNHKLSKTAHEEITSMLHSDHDVASYFYNKELEMTEYIKNILISNNLKDNNLNEKIHIAMGMVDNLCHEIIYHQHKNMNYDIMIDIVVNNIIKLFK